MKKRIIYIISSLILFFLIVFGIIFFLKKNNNKGKEIAVVNNKIHIYEKDVEKRLNFLSFDKKVKINDLQEEIVATMILEKIINDNIQKYAHKLGYDKDEKILQAVKDYKNDLIKEKFLEKVIYKDITDKEVTDEYAKILENINGKEERGIKHILVESEEEIRKIKTELKNENFERIAKKNSIDVSTKNYGGDLGYVIKEDLVPEFGNIAFILKKGEISNPFKTKYGWHIIKVYDIKPLKIKPLDSSKEMIKKRLQQEKFEKFLIEETKKYKIKFKMKFKKIENEKK